MGGGPGTPALAAAVSNAGGLGFLAGGYRSAAELAADIEATRALTDRPFGVNLFVPGAPVEDLAVVEYVASLHDDAARYGVEVGAPTFDDDDYPAKFELLATQPVAVVSFTFGCPSPIEIDRLHDVGTRALVTVTTPAEASVAAASGADGLCLQGFEAGAHRGSWDDTHGDANDYGVLALVAAARDLDVARIAAGGVMDGRDVAAVLTAGADAAQLGTAFLACPEAGTSPVHVHALTHRRGTVVTRAFTGRSARALRTAWTDGYGAGAPAAYPHIHHVTAPLRAHGKATGEAELVHLWAGTGHERLRRLPAGGLVRDLLQELAQAQAARRG
jgi:nitronate monooxygenase